MPLLLDIGDVPDDCCNDTLDELHKALSFGLVSHLWDRLPNRWLATQVERVSHRFTSIIEAMQGTLKRVLSGNAAELNHADAPWLRWDAIRFEQVRNRLEAQTPESMKIDDYSLLVEWLVNKYLPAGIIEKEADFLSVRAALLGKIQTNLESDKRVNDARIDRIVDLLPTSFAHVPAKALTPLEVEILDYGRAHAAENIRSVTSQTRHRLARTCMSHVQAQVLGQKEGSYKHLATALFDQFSDTGADFRRIAITESGEIHNQAYVTAKVAAPPPGSPPGTPRGPRQRVKRLEAYQGACDFCRSINGRIYNVVAANDPSRNGETDIWPGKDNVGRSASPTKRVGDHLVERPASERWWAASGLMHPNCRGSWAPVDDRPPSVSIEFYSFLQLTLDDAEAK